MAYYEKQSPQPSDTQTARAAHVNNIDNDCYVAFTQVDTDIQGIDDEAKSWAIGPPNPIDPDPDAPVESGEYCSKYHASNASDDADDAEVSRVAAVAAQGAAETAQTAAELAKTNAETAETNAETAQTAAELAETNAETAETNAGTSASDALDSEAAALVSETKANEWAENPEDDPVEAGEYSAYHWAKKAEGFTGDVILADGSRAMDVDLELSSNSPASALMAASKGYVDTQDVLKADLNSPAFTGNPVAVTQMASDRSTRLATTDFVRDALDSEDLQVANTEGSYILAPSTNWYPPAGWYMMYGTEPTYLYYQVLYSGVWRHFSGRFYEVNNIIMCDGINMRFWNNYTSNITIYYRKLDQGLI